MAARAAAAGAELEFIALDPNGWPESARDSRRLEPNDRIDDGAVDPEER